MPEESSYTGCLIFKNHGINFGSVFAVFINKRISLFNAYRRIAPMSLN